MVERKCLILCLLLLSSVSYSVKWSKNNVWKIQAGRTVPDGVLDFENIQFDTGYLQAVEGKTAWLRTYPISLGRDHVVKDMFINFSSTENAQVLMQLRSSEDDSILEQTYFSNSGAYSLQNIFHKEVYLSMEFTSNTVKMWSFGLTRQPEIVMNPEETAVRPGLLFYAEQVLDIHLRLRFPAYVDILVFDKYGTIIDYIAQNQLHSQGEYHYNWDPQFSSSARLHSGIYFIYFKTLSTEGKVVEDRKKFWLVHR